MKRLAVGMGLLLAGVLALTIHAQDAAGTAGKPSVVVGTFDSRAVAVAYARSERFQELLQGLRAELEAARAAGDEARAAEIEARGPAMQQRIHRQSFGTAPVDDILARVEKKLPQVAREAGVDVLVSKWALAYRRPGAELVDVTDALAGLFAPDEKTLGIIEELRERDPVPAEKLDRLHH